MQQRNIPLFISFLLIIALGGTSCGSTKSTLYNPKEVRQLSGKLGISIDNKNKNDDKHMALYAESSLWIGAPYRYGGITKSGVDCSGLVYQVYTKVYRKSTPRSTTDLAKKGKNVSKSKLKPGDLVFFATTNNKKKITHVGIFLKDGYFVHASTKRGVIVSHLNENYYKERWIKGRKL